MASTIQIRVDDDLKNKSDQLFKDLGTDTTSAIRMFLTQAVAYNGFPFGICIGAYCVANLMNIENIIVSRNLTRESIRSIDYNYLSNIASEDSYIILEDKLQDQNIDLKEETAIENILINIKKNEKTLSWQEFNISKMRIQKREQIYNE